MNAIVPLLALALVVALPLALRTIPGPERWGRAELWLARNLALPAAIPLVIGLPLPAGPGAGTLALPWLLAAGAGLLFALRVSNGDANGGPGPRHGERLAMAFWAVGAIAVFGDRLGGAFFGFDALLVRLAAVHFHVAGVILVLAGTTAWRRAPARWLELAIGALVIGIPLTALGFFGLPLVNRVGALLVAAGGTGIGVAHLRIAVRGLVVPAAARLLLAIAGLSLVVAMAFAGAYATARVAGLTIEPGLMAGVHGTLNVAGFAVPSMIGWWLVRRREQRSVGPSVRARRDPARLATIAGLLIVAYAGVVGLVVQRDGASDPPGALPSWAVTVALLALPGLIALLAARRGPAPLIAVAGAICLVQAFVSFAGVTLPLLVPAAVLLTAASGAADGLRVREIASSGLVLAAWLAAWAARLTQVEERCWTPAAGEVACSSAVPTTAGIAATLALAVAALAIAALAPGPAPTPHDARQGGQAPDRG